MKSFFFDRALEDNSKTIRLLNKGSILAAGFFGELPSVTMTNNWGGNDGNFITGLIDKVANAAKSSAGRRIISLAEQNEMIKNLVGQDAINAAKLATNAHVTSIDNLIKQYNGTATSLSLDPLNIMAIYEGGKYTPLIVDSLNATDPGASVAKLLGYIVGDYQVDGKASRVSDWIGVQLAPNNYSLDPAKAIKSVVDGTFELEIGNTVKLKNIVITNVELKKSPQVVKGKSPMPLWMDVVLSFEFARELSVKDVIEYYNLN